jgi:hypothetical protein
MKLLALELLTGIMCIATTGALIMLMYALL